MSNASLFRRMERAESVMMKGSMPRTAEKEAAARAKVVEAARAPELTYTMEEVFHAA